MQRTLRATLALLLLLSASLVAGCNDDPAGPGVIPEPLPEAESSSVVIDGLDLHYLDWGGEGETIVFLAGLGNSSWVWLDFAPRFARDHRVLALTRRAHGPSDVAPDNRYDTAALTQDVLGFLDAMGVDRAILIGHSMAGDELTRMAEDHPERISRLVYLDAAYDRATLPAVMAQMPEDTGAIPPEIETLDDYREFLRSYFYGFWSDALEKEMLIEQEFESDPFAMAAMFEGSTQAAPDYTQIEVPALSIYSLPDFRTTLRPDAPAEYIQALVGWQENVLYPSTIAHAQRFTSEVSLGEVVVMEDTHHYLFIQKDEEVYQSVRSFLRGE